MSMTKAISKIYEQTLYNEAVNNPIYGQRWHKAIKNRLQNLRKITRRGNTINSL